MENYKGRKKSNVKGVNLETASAIANLRMVQRDTVHSTIEHIKKVNRDIDFQMEKLLIQEASDISSMDSEPYEMLKKIQ